MTESKDEWKARMGIGQAQNKHHVHAGTAKTWTVTADDGPARGRTVGAQKEHWSGRVDAKVTSGRTTQVNPNLKTRRLPYGRT